ncbi:unnamed protein product [Camellia sinensis]
MVGGEMVQGISGRQKKRVTTEEMPVGPARCSSWMRYQLEFAKAFQAFHVGQQLGDELLVPIDKAKCHPAALTTKKYGVSRRN